jgi:capsular polysaccharide export protein
MDASMGAAIDAHGVALCCGSEIMAQRFLFLQGVCSPFFKRLADALVEQGHFVHKVNFNGGDRLYWGLRHASAYRGHIDDLAPFIDRVLLQYNITDIVLFGDCRPVHQVAIRQAKRVGCRIHVFEEGYLRPHWVTLERDGINANSLLPRAPDWFASAVKRLPVSEPVKPFKSSFLIRVWHDVHYHVGSIVNPLFYPRYQTHAPMTAPVEYSAYLRRLPVLGRYKQRDNATISRLVNDKVGFYLLPLQLNGDAQIRVHSSYADMEAVLQEVMASFAEYAPHNTRLVIKNHPLDMWVIDYPAVIARLAKQFGIVDRIDYLETGNADLLLQHALGVVTVNSTVGLQALLFGCPVKTLSNPVYHMAGMTHQGTLDSFWAAPDKPDMTLVAQFKAVLIHATQVNGGFYSREGIALAVKNSVLRLVSVKSPLEVL